MGNFPSIGFGANDKTYAEGQTCYDLDAKNGPQNLGGIPDQPEKIFGAKPPERNGEVPNPGSGFVGYTIPFKSVAPVKYPVLGKDTPKKTRYVLDQPD